MNESELIIDGIVFPKGSARAIQQSLRLVQNGQLRRTVNGKLVDLTRATNQKYESSISVTDLATPTIGNFWRGRLLTIECISILRETVEPQALSQTLHRTPVEGSIRGLDANDQVANLISVNGNIVTFGELVTHIEFRPILKMRIENIDTSREEYTADESWSIDLAEE